MPNGYIIDCFVQMSEMRLNTPPQDGITAVKFAPKSSQFLLISSWDATVRLHDVDANAIVCQYGHENAVLDCCFQVKAAVIFMYLRFIGSQ